MVEIPNPYKNQTMRLGFIESLIAVLGAFGLYFLDIATLWNGYSLGFLMTSGAWTIMEGAFKILFSGFLAFRIIKLAFVDRKNLSQILEIAWESALYFIWILAVMVGSSDPVSMVHLLFSVLIYFTFKKAVTHDKPKFDAAIFLLTFMDIFGWATLSFFSSGVINATQFNRFMVPFWVYYSLLYSIQHQGHWIWTVGLVAVTLIFFGMAFDGITLIAQQTDQVDQGIVTGMWFRLVGSANRLIYNIVGLPAYLTGSWTGFWNEATNTSIYASPNQAQTQFPEGVFMEIVDLGDMIYREGAPVYLLASIKARTLDEPIRGVTVGCKTTVEEEVVTLNGIEIVSREVLGTAGGSSGGGSLTFDVLTSVERSAPCVINDLPGGQYDIEYTGTFSHTASGKQLVYLMDEKLYLDDSYRLQQQGTNPSKAAILGLYGFTNTDPQADSSSGPVGIGIKTDNSPWDVGSSGKYGISFFVTVENMGEHGGMISSIENIILKVPDSFSIISDSCSHNVQSTSQNSEPGYNAYKIVPDPLTPLVNITEFVTVGCFMNVGSGSLDSTPVTRRFLKADVDYTYLMKDVINIEVEGTSIGPGGPVGPGGTPRVCCASISGGSRGSAPSYDFMSPSSCVSTDFVVAYQVPDKDCQKVCCLITNRLTQTTYGQWETSTESCLNHGDGYDIFSSPTTDTARC